MDSEQSQVAGFLPDFAGEFVFFFHLEGQLLVKLALDEVPDCFLNVLLGFVEHKIHSIPPELDSNGEIVMFRVQGVK